MRNLAWPHSLLIFKHSDPNRAVIREAWVAHLQLRRDLRPVLLHSERQCWANRCHKTEHRRIHHSLWEHLHTCGLDQRPEWLACQLQVDPGGKFWMSWLLWKHVTTLDIFQTSMTVSIRWQKWLMETGHIITVSTLDWINKQRDLNSKTGHVITVSTLDWINKQWDLISTQKTSHKHYDKDLSHLW